MGAQQVEICRIEHLQQLIGREAARGHSGSIPARST
jgi:hypothetical protein